MPELTILVDQQRDPDPPGWPPRRINYLTVIRHTCRGKLFSIGSPA